MPETSSVGYPATPPAKAPPKQIPSHAERLHLLAKELGGCNARLEQLLERLVGPIPQSTGGDPNKPTEPQGVLYVAEFGAERISQEINLLSQYINRLENLG